MTAMTEQELLPCPFCGAEMELPVPGGFARGPGELHVICDCGAMGAGGKTVDEAIAAWNRRAPIQPAAAPEPFGYLIDMGGVLGERFVKADELAPEHGMRAQCATPLYTAAPAPADARDAAEALVKDALDEVREQAHPCDQSDDDLVARLLPPLMQNLRRALKRQPAQSEGSQKGGV